jgi:hypothetical protein
MKLIITIDTEEDNWSSWSAANNSVGNIEQIIPLQKLFDRYGARPTYLVSYPVATNPRSVQILKRILEEDKCEIGMHCHPWNTPPLKDTEEIGEQDTMLCNIPADLVYEKLSHLDDTIYRNFGVKAQSFRAGRWGFGPAVARALCRLDYRCDTSVTPYVNWEHYNGPDFSELGPGAFKFTGQGVEQKSENGFLVEIPVTIGVLHRSIQLLQIWIRTLRKSLPRGVTFNGILKRLTILNTVWLSPETSEPGDMILLANRMKKNNASFLNLTFHSVSLQKGLSPFVKTKEDEARFMESIECFLRFACNAGWQGITLKDLEKSQP